MAKCFRYEWCDRKWVGHEGPSVICYGKDKKCNIIERKPKPRPKTKKFKAWAMIKGESVFAGNSGPYKWRKTPCHIVIEAKYLVKKVSEKDL